MNDPNLSHAPYLSLRHARTGRVGGEGCLPSGWRGEHTAEVKVMDVGSDAGKPSLAVSFKFNADVASEFIGLCLGPYLPVPRKAVVALAAHVTLAEWDNLAAALMIVREWREGGEFVGQSSRPLALREAPRIGLVAHQVGDETCLAEPVLMVKRRSAGPGGLTVTLVGVAFGNLYDHPRWLCG